MCKEPVTSIITTTVSKANVIIIAAPTASSRRVLTDDFDSCDFMVFKSMKFITIYSLFIEHNCSYIPDFIVRIFNIINKKESSVHLNSLLR